LLIADVGPRKVRPVRRGKAALALGDEIERLGYVTEAKLHALTDAVRAQRRRARQLGCEVLQVLVASPGRQAANAEDLVAGLRRTAGASVRVLSAVEEAILAYEGVLASVRDVPETVGVCDVGGGSTQLVVGTPRTGPAWTRSVDLGAVRLARRALDADPPGREAIEAAREEAERAFSGVTPPLPRVAYAVGGTARNLAKLADGPLDADALDRVIELLAETPTERVARRFGIGRERARTLPAGAVLLAEAQRRFCVNFTVSRNGLREGAVLALARQAAAA
jgi:exopolyphosphatase/guanosine-5'-triphosphate,3'-diphosphate pyrophosphatase